MARKVRAATSIASHLSRRWHRALRATPERSVTCSATSRSDRSANASVSYWRSRRHSGVRGDEMRCQLLPARPLSHERELTVATTSAISTRCPCLIGPEPAHAPELKVETSGGGCPRGRRHCRKRRRVRGRLRPRRQGSGFRGRGPCHEHLCFRWSTQFRRGLRRRRPSLAAVVLLTAPQRRNSLRGGLAPWSASGHSSSERGGSLITDDRLRSRWTIRSRGGPTCGGYCRRHGRLHPWTSRRWRRDGGGSILAKQFGIDVIFRPRYRARGGRSAAGAKSSAISERRSCRVALVDGAPIGIIAGGGSARRSADHARGRAKRRRRWEPPLGRALLDAGLHVSERSRLSHRPSDASDEDWIVLLAVLMFAVTTRPGARAPLPDGSAAPARIRIPPAGRPGDLAPGAAQSPCWS